MTSWKDTVMSEDDAIDGYYSVTQEEYDILGLLEAQAKIAFPAGEKQGIEKGRREVVEWVRTVGGYDRFTATNGQLYGCITVIEETWQAKLKEWGLDDG